MTTLSMGVVIENGSQLTLVAALPSIGVWNETLDALELPPGWIISVIDMADVILARRPQPAIFVGRSIHPDALVAIRSGESGWGTGMSQDGNPVHIAYQATKTAPWMVLVGVPRDTVDGMVLEALAPVVSVGAILLALTLLAAWFLGKRFTIQMGDVAEAAIAFREGQEARPLVKTSRIRELAELKSALESASEERSIYERQLHGLIADKDLLMQEGHHRVKNSLQLVRGVLSLQARSACSPEAREALTAAAARIVTVADIHQHLYQGTSTTEVNVRRYLQALAQDLAGSLLDGVHGRAVESRAPDVMWSAEKVTAVGLIATELVTNAIKHGAGRVTIDLQVAADGGSTLVVGDEGTGFAEDYRFGEGRGLGSKLITSLVRSEEGSITIDGATDQTRVVVRMSPQWRSRERRG